MKNPLFTKKVKERVAQAAGKHDLELVLAFGSGAQETMHERSDLDIAVATKKSDLQFDELGEISLEIQSIFPTREVDLAIINRADPLFLKKIMEAPVLLYGSRRVLSEFKIYAYKRYVDHKPFLEMEKKFAIDYAHRAKKTAG